MMNNPTLFRLLGTVTILCAIPIGIAEHRYPFEPVLHGIICMVMADVMDLKRKAEAEE